MPIPKCQGGRSAAGGEGGRQRRARKGKKARGCEDLIRLTG